MDSGKHVFLLGQAAGALAAAMVAGPELQARTRRVNGVSGGIMGLF